MKTENVTVDKIRVGDFLLVAPNEICRVMSIRQRNGRRIISLSNNDVISAHFEYGRVMRVVTL